ncbi:hypothetical protein C9374_009985 [Naegleria lovaniensis]|uniref:Uncharacterized protein n=1 Tax=Naegleria lovaniensis TaxID=51637 RepID=A0AA88GD80_NAELO|nr:uncharacterized protein C9374_009985 [Naegleria lovaniensis]KAG2375362.1 hypothetical protein C9374_009985 [Naegleria lovaniensis]
MTSLNKRAILNNSPLVHSSSAGFSSSSPALLNSSSLQTNHQYSNPNNNNPNNNTMDLLEQQLSVEAEEFERKLQLETQDPLKRALSRREFYATQEERRAERKRELGTMAKRKERAVVGQTALERLEKKCSPAFLHSREFEANMCVGGTGGQLTEKAYLGPLLVYSGDVEQKVNSSSSSSSSSSSNNNNSTGSAGSGENSVEGDADSNDHHSDKKTDVHHEEEEADSHHVDVIHEAIFEEQKRLVETLQSMQNGEKPLPSGMTSKPVFLGEDGTLYNLYYEPLPNQDATQMKGRGKFSKIAYGSSAKGAEQEFGEGYTKAKELKNKKIVYNSEQEQILKKYGPIVDKEEIGVKCLKRARMLDRYEYEYDPELYQSAPDPDSFTTFEEYEEALLNWSKQVEGKLGYLQLPRVMGRHYFRPCQRPVISENEGDNTRSDASKLNSRRIAENISSISMKSSIMDDDMNESHETWESHLVPLEPKPEFYETFKEYETAMIRWAITCLGLPFLPPHVAQYQNLLGLKLVNEPKFQVAGVQTSNNDSGEEEKEDREDGDHNDDEDRKDDDHDSVRYEVLNGWEKLKPNVKREIENSIQKVMDAKMKNKETFGSFHQPAVALRHGTFASETKVVPLKLTQGERIKPDNIRSWIVYQRQEKSLSCVPAQGTMAYEQANASREYPHQMPLIRRDLTDEEVRSSKDCDTFEQGKEVLFETPEFDLGVITFANLKSQNYVKFLQIVLARKDNEKRFNQLNSWYFPKEDQFALVQKFDALCSILDVIEHPSQMTIQHFENIFSSSTYLDYFQKFLQTELKLRMSMMKNGVEIPLRTYRELMFYSTSKQTFIRILHNFHNCNSQLTHAKVAHFVKEFLKTEMARDIISEILQEDDYSTMYFIARAVTLFDEVPSPLFEYTESTRNAVINIVLIADTKKKDEALTRMVDKFLVNLLLLYYTNCITVSLVEEDRGYPFVYQFLVQKLEKYIEEVNKYLKCSKSFLKTYIWKILGSKCKAVTALGKFVMTFLFFLSWKEDIKNALKSEDTDLLANIRTLACSKFSHVQNATARLFPLLKEWEELLTKDYKNGQNVLRDLVKSAERAVLDSQPPLISSMVLEFLSESLTIKKNEFGEKDASFHMIVGLIETRVFHIVLEEVISTVTQKRMHQGTIMGSLFIAKFAKYLVCNQLVQAPSEKTSDSSSKNKLFSFLRKKETVEVKQALYSGSKVEVTQSNLQNMWDFIGKQDKLRRTYRPRSAMLVAFRHLIKVPEVFALFNRDATFYTKLLELCKDDVDMEFNRNAWRLFYQLIKFHGEEVMSEITNHNMSGFLSTISLQQKSIIATNALHYFNKIFNLPIDRNIWQKVENDDKRPELVCEKGNNIPAKAHDKYHKAVQILIDFILKQKLVDAVFVAAYNIWSKDYKGWPFQTLAALFYTIHTHSSCQKLQQAFAKTSSTLSIIENMVKAPPGSKKSKYWKDVMDWNMKHKHYSYIAPPKWDERK